jgi:hypothetical protein
MFGKQVNLGESTGKSAGPWILLFPKYCQDDKAKEVDTSDVNAWELMRNFHRTVVVKLESFFALKFYFQV